MKKVDKKQNEQSSNWRRGYLCVSCNRQALTTRVRWETSDKVWYSRWCQSCLREMGDGKPIHAAEPTSLASGPNEQEQTLSQLAVGGLYRIHAPEDDSISFESMLSGLEKAENGMVSLHFENGVTLRTRAGDQTKFYWRTW